MFLFAPHTEPEDVFAADIEHETSYLTAPASTRYHLCRAKKDIIRVFHIFDELSEQSDIAYSQ